MSATNDEQQSRSTSYGQVGSATVVDRFGVWLSMRKTVSVLGPVEGKRFADLGCGFNATGARTVIDRAAHTTLVDLALAEDLQQLPKVTAILGHLPEAMAQIESESLDLVVCSAVLEHLSEPERMLAEIRRVMAPGGCLFLTVPNWLGKRFLELSAFRLGLSPMLEMDDHKTYYDPKDLWPLLRRAGFLPHDITCRRYKFGLNTYARCRVGA